MFGSLKSQLCHGHVSYASARADVHHSTFHALDERMQEMVRLHACRLSTLGAHKGAPGIRI